MSDSSSFSIRPSRPDQNDLFSSSSSLAVLSVTTKPSPSLPPLFEMLWLTIPITSPFMLNMGPPELPVLIVASVWKNSASGMVLYTVLGAQRALMYPTLSEWLRPYGAPTMMTWSPTWTEFESAIGATFAPTGTLSSCSSDTSAACSDATTRAVIESPPRNSTVISSMEWTTCAAVITWPL